MFLAKKRLFSRPPPCPFERQNVFNLKHFPCIWENFTWRVSPYFLIFGVFFAIFPQFFTCGAKKKEFEICECSAAFRPIIVGSHCGDAVLSIRPALTPSSEGASSQEWVLECQIRTVPSAKHGSACKNSSPLGNAVRSHSRTGAGSPGGSPGWGFFDPIRRRSGAFESQRMQARMGAPRHASGWRN